MIRKYQWLLLSVMLLFFSQSGVKNLQAALLPVDQTVAGKEMQKTIDQTSSITPTASLINPLTGLPPENPNLLDRRPVMVKVSNFPQYGRPHAGLSFADIVFDYFIGYGTNRFLAVYYGHDAEMIGPVRSGRFVDPQLVMMYSGILAYGSADEDTDKEIVTELGDYAISNLEVPEPMFIGTDTHSPVGVFANSNALSQYVTEQGWENNAPDLPGMLFDPQVPNHGKIADQVHILFNYYNRGEWRFDPKTGKYLRWIEFMENAADTTYEMIPLVDRLTGDQLAFSNVIIIYADHTELAPSRHLIDIRGNDKGKPAIFFRDGQVFSGSWRAVHDADPLQFFNDVGEPMTLKPGNSWIVIADPSSSFREIEDGVWELFFSLS